MQIYLCEVLQATYKLSSIAKNCQKLTIDTIMPKVIETSVRLAFLIAVIDELLPASNGRISREMWDGVRARLDIETKDPALRNRLSKERNEAAAEGLYNPCKTSLRKAPGKGKESTNCRGEGGDRGKDDSEPEFAKAVKKTKNEAELGLGSNVVTDTGGLVTLNNPATLPQPEAQLGAKKSPKAPTVSRNVRGGLQLTPKNTISKHRNRLNINAGDSALALRHRVSKKRNQAVAEGVYSPSRTSSTKSPGKRTEFSTSGGVDGRMNAGKDDFKPKTVKKKENVPAFKRNPNYFRNGWFPTINGNYDFEPKLANAVEMTKIGAGLELESNGFSDAWFPTLNDHATLPVLKAQKGECNSSKALSISRKVRATSTPSKTITKKRYKSESLRPHRFTVKVEQALLDEYDDDLYSELVKSSAEMPPAKPEARRQEELKGSDTCTTNFEAPPPRFASQLIHMAATIRTLPSPNA